MISRYTLPEMGAVWTEDNKFRTWLQVELAVCRVLAERGVIPKRVLAVIERKADFDIKRIETIEAEVNHDVIAFLTSVAEFVGAESKYIHFGMTSSDVVDTALALQIQQAVKLIDKRLSDVLKQIRGLAQKYKMTPIIGRTHGVFAEPTSLGLKFAVWYTELARGRQRLSQAAEGVAVGKISGAVGNFANLDPIVEEKVCKKLGLSPAPVSTQIVQRDRHAAFISALALIGSSLEKFATEVRHLHRSEIGEIQEGFTKGQKGSSAMPHKKNPITSERVAGLARVLRGNALAAMENISLWHERDITHSSVERVIIPDSCVLLDYMLEKFSGILRNLVIDKKKMREHIFTSGGVVFSQRLLLKLAGPAESREIAYRLVQENAMKAHKGEGLFSDLVKHDPRISALLSPEEIDDCFSLDYYLRNVSAIFRRVFR